MIGFTAALSKYFGRREGQTLQEFSAEINKLTHADKLELRPMLAAALGEEVEEPRQAGVK